MNYIIFGGSGFIGTHLIKSLKNEVNTEKDRIYNIDIVMPGEVGVVPGEVENIDDVNYIRGDVRTDIDFDFVPTPYDIIFNLAAVHRTPGHLDYDYFDTNISGAENVVKFAEKYNISKILFTSSIAPYGAAEQLKSESTLPTPNIPYGISKLVAEKIHEKWQVQDANRELTILRPGVVFGKGEYGNFSRLYWGQRKHYFFYPGRKDTVKASMYVKELVGFMRYRMIENSFKGNDIFNCTVEPAFVIEEICQTMQMATNMKRYIPLVPSWMLMTAARILGPLGGKKVGLHPDRVKKLMISTNISGEKLAASGYEFKYTLESAIADWYEECGKEGLN